LLREVICFIAAAVAVFRLSLLVVDDPGPFEALDRLRERLGIFWVYDFNAQREHIPGTGQWVSENALGETLSCFWCVSLLAGSLIALATRCEIDAPWLLVGLAHSGISILLRKRFKVERY